MQLWKEKKPVIRKKTANICQMPTKSPILVLSNKTENSAQT